MIKSLKINNMRKYIVIDLRRSTKETPMFWRPDDMGYTTNPFEAGLYDELHILARWNHYNDKVETIAVPVDQAGLAAIGFTWSWDWKKAAELLDEPYLTKNQ
jgi:hypothetical protein